MCNLFNCIQCVQGTVNIECKMCQNNTYLHNSSCLLTCPSNAYPSVTATLSTCIMCTSNCLTCNENGCTSCTTGLLPLLLNRECVSSCPEKYYISNNVCLLCDISNCLSCSNSQSCLNCQQPYMLDNSSRCSLCLHGYYMISGSCLVCSQ